MIDSFFLVGGQVLCLFLLMTVGFIFGKARLLDNRAVLGMSNLMLYVVVPSLTIVSFQRPLERQGFHLFCAAFLLSFAIHLLSILLSALALRGAAENHRRIFRFGVIFSNCGFMGLPLEQALLGPIGVFYGSAYTVVFNLLAWTYGLRLFSGQKGKLSLRFLLTPGVIGVGMALALYLLQIGLPELLLTPLTYLSQLNTALPMVILGYQLSQADLRSVLRGANFWIAAGLRLVLIPALALGLCLVLGIQRQVFIVTVIAAATPPGALLPMFAAKFGGDTELASGLMATQTLLSVVTMPLIVSLATYLA